MKFRLLAATAAALLFTAPVANAEMLFIRTLSGQTLNIEIGLDDTVAVLKDAVQSQAGIPSEEQRLIYAGQQLEDTNTLTDYGIEHEATLHLVRRLRAE